MPKRMIILFSFLILLQAAGSGLSAGVVNRPYPAPEWAVSGWLNGDPGSLQENRNRVILIDFFQLWCPGCNRFSIPLFREWEEKYGKRDDILIVSIHTVFEGHASQTPHRLGGFLREKKIRHPVGIDAYPDGSAEIPITMRRYRTGGTPNVTIIDKQGRIETEVNLGPVPARLILEIWGRIFRDGERPEFDFDIQFRKLGDDPAWDCEITASGRGIKKNHLE